MFREALAAVAVAVAARYALDAALGQRAVVHTAGSIVVTGASRGAC